MTATITRAVFTGVLAAVGAGLVVGVVGRILMRATTLLAGGTPGFSWSGSASVVVVYAVAMIPGAIVAALTTRRGSTLPLVAGAVLLCFPAVGIASEEVGYLGDLGPVRLAAVLVCGTAVFGTLALLPLVTLRLVRLATATRVPAS
ncbi:hypothetical protein [Rhodococcus gannanensis]|uniref:Major facilitator superfamily (MFS) profile domain-containing protein n=1 Tax=Rhodococcus gannanensis TaxID=1960308 RepID=A0ABW4P5S1_9NOCA